MIRYKNHSCRGAAVELLVLIAVMRKGFTVIELLVVTTIMVVLFGLLLGRPGDGRTVKSAAQEFASILRNTKSKALCNEVGDGVVIEPESNSGIVISNSYILPFIECKVTKMPNPVNNGVYPSSIDVGLNPLNASLDDLKRGYKVRFYAQSDSTNQSYRGLQMSEWYCFNYENPPTAKVSIDKETSQNSRNSYWHPLLDCGGLDNSQPKTNIIAGVARHPIKSGVAMIFPKVATIYFRYSGSGNDTSQTWGDLSQEGSIGVVFDKLGCLDALVKQKPVSYIDPFEIVYFFIVNRRDMISNKGLSIIDAFWVAIQPNTGQVVVANHIPQENNDNDSLIASRENARKSFNIGGK